MMYRHLFFLFLYLCSIHLAGQKTSVELGRTYNSSGDKYLTSAAFSHQIKKVQLSTRFVFGSGSFVLQPEEGPYYTYIDNKGTYIFAGQGLQPGVFPTDVGIITLPTKTDHYLHIYSNIDYTFKIFGGNSKTQLTSYFGPSVAYINESFLVEAVDGTFSSPFYSDTDIRLVVTQYLRYIDIGGHAQATLQHNFSDDLGVRLSLNLYYFLDEQFSLQLGGGVAF